MSATIAYGRALYYPHIDFHNEKWIKTAALYYKGLNRIVPEGFTDFKDSDTIKKLNENDEFIKNLSPTSASVEVEIDFFEFAQSELTSPKKRKKLIDNLGSKISTTKPYTIHTKKLGRLLQNNLPKIGLAVKSKGYDWIEFEPVTGAMYMTFLANALAKEDQIPIVTDEPEFQPLIRGIQLDRYRGNRDVGETLASMVIESVVPENIENIPVEKIIKIRTDYKDERRQFYNEINKLVKDLESVDKESVLIEALEEKKKDIELAVRNIKMSYAGIGVATVTTMLGLSIPSFASGLGFGIAVVGGVAVAAGKLTEQGINYYKSKNGSPYSYVLSLKSELNTKSFAQQLLKGNILI